MKGAFKNVRVGYLGNQIRGVSYSKGEAFAAPGLNLLPILRAGNITDSGLTYDDLQYIPQHKITEKQLLKHGDILIAASSGSKEVVGKASYVERDWNGSFGAFCKVFRPDVSKVYPKFIAHYFNSNKYRHTISNLAAGANINNLRNEHIDNLEILLPPLSEQKRIAAILDKAEEIKRKREESLKLADEFLKSVFVDMFGDPVTNPKGWERAPLGRLTKIDAPMVDPKKKEYLDLIHIAPNNIEKCTGQLLPAKTAREDNLISGKFLFTEKHVLYSKIRPYLRKGALPDFSGLCSADMYPIEPIKNVLTREYLLFILLSDAFDDYTKTIPGRANIPKINRTELNAYETIVPDYALQKDFSKIYRKIKERREHLANTDFENKLFGSLSQKAFNGDL